MISGDKLFRMLSDFIGCSDLVESSSSVSSWITTVRALSSLFPSLPLASIAMLILRRHVVWFRCQLCRMCPLRRHISNSRGSLLTNVSRYLAWSNPMLVIYRLATVPRWWCFALSSTITTQQQNNLSRPTEICVTERKSSFNNSVNLLVPDNNRNVR